VITDSEIEEAAILLCIAYGLDPDERITHGQNDINRVKDKTEYTYDVAIYSPRWKLFVPEAEKLIAGHRVLRQLAGEL
jgi:hypothetical protein